MNELDTPWGQPESPEVAENLDTAEWFDEGPFSTGAIAEADPSVGVATGFEDAFTGATGTPAVLSEDLIAGCGSVPSGPRPLLLRGTGTTNSRNPSVGYAQTLLNVFLDASRAGTAGCTDTSPSTVRYIASLRALLASLRQDPLVVDCDFGQATEAATKMFQACRTLVRDGKIGDKTWPALEALAPGQPAPPAPVPVPPAPVPPATPAVRVRQDVWTLSAADPWHPILLWYARGVRSLQARDTGRFEDPRSWRHLAATHGTVIRDPRWPAGAQWDSCRHGSWYFLPWHRLYLHHFERIMRDEIVRLGGMSDWALPYWNYSDTTRPEVRQLPQAFKVARLPDGSPNPLRVSQREAAMNLRGMLAADVVDIAAACAETAFTLPFGPGFGGRSAPTGSVNGVQGGVLEDTMHGLVHGAVGGRQPDGLMSLFETAAQDPIFWLHHANVDRLWEAWLRSRPTNRNPTDGAWRNERFIFGSGTTCTALTTMQMVDPRQPPLGYRYADMPVTPTPEAIEERPDEAPTIIGEDEGRPPELVGASTAPFPLGTRSSTARVEMSSPTGPVAAAMTEGGAPPPDARVYLRLENITGTTLHATGFVVHVNVPAGGVPRDFPDRRAGVVSMFGVIESSRRSTTHSGSGRDVTFDITRIVRALSTAGTWNPRQLAVSFTPIPDATGKVADGDVKIGRVSLFYA